MKTTKTNPTNIQEAHEAAFRGKLNMVKCADHCGLTLKEFKMTFREFLKYNDVDFCSDYYSQLDLF